MNVYKIAAWVPISRELAEEMDRLRRPWLYPDPPLDMHIDPFPWWTRATRCYTRLLEAVSSDQPATYRRSS